MATGYTGTGAPAGLTVGQGISLEGRDSGDLPYIRLLQSYDAERSRRGAAKKQDIAQLQGLYKDIQVDPNKFHRILVPELQKDAADTWGKIMQMHQEDPNNYQWGAINAIEGLKQRTMQAQALSQNYNQIKNIPENQLTAPQKQIRGILDSGNFSDLQKVQPDPLGSAAVGQDGSVHFGWTVNKDKNHTGEFQNILKNIDIPPLDAQGNPTSQFVKGKPTMVGNKLVQPIVETTPIPVDVAANKGAEYWASNPDLYYKEAEANRQDILKGSINIDHPDGTKESIPVKNQDGSLNEQNLHEALFKKWFNNASQGNMTKTKGVSYQDYTPPQTKPSGYNRGQGTASGDRFNSSLTSDGGAITPVSGTEKYPQVPVDAPYALKGDAPEANLHYADSDYNKRQTVSFQGWKQLTNPSTGKKEMFFVVSKAPEAEGSITKKRATGAQGQQEIKNYKVKGSEDVFLIPAYPDQEKKFFTYSANKNGSNPHKEAYLDSKDQMNEYNKTVGGKTSTQSSEGAFDQGPATKPLKDTQSYKMDGKSYTVKDLKGLGYSEQEIQDALSKGLLK